MDCKLHDFGFSMMATTYPCKWGWTRQLLGRPSCASGRCRSRAIDRARGTHPALVPAHEHRSVHLPVALAVHRRLRCRERRYVANVDAVADLDRRGAERA